MALGYEIGTIMKRTSTSYSDEKISIKLDDIEGVDRTFVQVRYSRNQSSLVQDGQRRRAGCLFVEMSCAMERRGLQHTACIIWLPALSLCRNLRHKAKQNASLDVEDTM